MALKVSLNQKTQHASRHCLSICSSCFPNARDLGQHRLGLNLESDTVQPVHEPLPKTCRGEDSASTKVNIIL